MRGEKERESERERMEEGERGKEVCEGEMASDRREKIQPPSPPSLSFYDTQVQLHLFLINRKRTRESE